MRRIARIVLLVVIGAMLGAEWLAPSPYDRQNREEPAAAPSLTHPLGTDAVGRDRLSRLLYGGRVSILLAPAAALVSVALALAVALAAATLGAAWERMAAGVIDLVLSLPWLFLLLIVRAALPLNTSPVVSIALIFALLGLLGWAAPARVLMAAARGQLGSDHALAARASGCSRWRLALVHLVPNLAPVVRAQFWVTVPAFLLSEANLALLGLGISEPMPSWGGLLRDLQDFSALARQPWIAAPLVLLVLTLSCCQIASTSDEYSL